MIQSGNIDLETILSLFFNWWQMALNMEIITMPDCRVRLSVSPYQLTCDFNVQRVETITCFQFTGGPYIMEISFTCQNQDTDISSSSTFSLSLSFLVI